MKCPILKGPIVMVSQATPSKASSTIGIIKSFTRAWTSVPG